MSNNGSYIVSESHLDNYTNIQADNNLDEQIINSTTKCQHENYRKEVQFKNGNKGTSSGRRVLPPQLTDATKVDIELSGDFYGTAESIPVTTLSPENETLILQNHKEPADTMTLNTADGVVNNITNHRIKSDHQMAFPGVKHQRQEQIEHVTSYRTVEIDDLENCGKVKYLSDTITCIGDSLAGGAEMSAEKTYKSKVGETMHTSEHIILLLVDWQSWRVGKACKVGRHAGSQAGRHTGRLAGRQARKQVGR